MLSLKTFLALNIILFFSVFICDSGEIGVCCVFNESCVLPCSFQRGFDPVIHWLKLPGDVPVHLYYRGRDQDSHRNKTFKGRTSLFVDQFSRGNFSLLLREVKLQDEGTYMCYTSTADSASQDSFINLTVRAPVSFVNIEQRGDELICSSKDIYPKPDVSWSLRPPPPDVEPNTSVSVSEKGLYSIFSSVTLSHKPPEEHSCNISTDHSWSSATYRLQHPRSISGNEVTVPCSASNAPIKSLIWKFNQTQTILTQTGTNRDYNESWRQFVEEVSESGRLTLKNLSSGHQGVYSCVLSSDRETLISSTEVREEAPPDPPSTTLYVVLGVFLFIITFILLIVSVLWWKRVKVLERLRKIEKRLGEIKEEKKKLKKEKESLEDHQQELADLGINQIKFNLLNYWMLTGVSNSGQLLTWTDIVGGCTVLQRLREIEIRLGEIKEETKKLKKEKESLEDQRRRKLFPEKDRSKDGQEKVEASAETLLNLNELTRGNQPPSEALSQVSKRLKEIRERLKEIKEETESLRANPVRELFSEKDRSPFDRPEMSADTQTGGNLRTSKLPSQVLQRLKEVEQHLEKLKQEQRNLEEETQLLKDQRLRELFPDDSSPSDGSVQ